MPPVNVNRNQHGEVSGPTGLNHKIGRQHGPGLTPKLGKTMSMTTTSNNFKPTNKTSPNGGKGTC